MLENEKAKKFSLITHDSNTDVKHRRLRETIERDMAYWLVKSEPEEYSIDDFIRDKVTSWSGVRNYQARNYLRQMDLGDSILFYHSSSDPTGIVGIARVSKRAYADPTQFDSKSDYYDEKATKSSPRWFSPDIKFLKKFPRMLTLAELKKDKGLQKMVLLQRGSRLSVQPVTQKEFTTIVGLSQRVVPLK